MAIAASTHANEIGIKKLQNHYARRDHDGPAQAAVEGCGAGWYTCGGSMERRFALGPGCGVVAQLGERLVRNEEASGSIPLNSTILSITCGMGRKANDTFVSLLAS
jgi:hypothetical protein